MKHSVCILDYGAGNVRSVRNAFEFLGVPTVVSNDETELQSATHLVLPGVGAFGAAMSKIQDTIPVDTLERLVRQERRPFLGICVGMQVLATTGLEFGEHRGLGWVPGTVRRMEVGTLTLPHMGWNEVSSVQEDPIMNGLDAVRDFYFVHSYHFEVTEPSHVIAECSYGNAFSAIVRSGNIYGIQFHPEKSQKAGLKILTNFLEAG